MTPFDKLFQVWIHAYLIDEPRNLVDTTVNFDIEIGNICEFDTISFATETLIGDVEYILGDPVNRFDESFIIV